MRGYIGKGKALYFLNLRYFTEEPRPGLRPDGHILELLRFTGQTQSHGRGCGGDVWERRGGRVHDAGSAE